MGALRDQAEDGRVSLTDWLYSLRDKRVQAKMRVRIRRLESGMRLSVESEEHALT